MGRLAEGNWQKDIDVRDFIQKNYTPYEGDESFLADATEKTKHLWQYLDDNYLAVERKQRVYDVDTHTPAGIDAFGAGYIDSPEVDNVVVGLQTDVPCKRAMMPNGGWRMVEQAISRKPARSWIRNQEDFHQVRKTPNDGVFGVYTKQIKVTPQQDPHRPAGCLRPWPHHRRLPSWHCMVNTLIKFKQRDKDSVPYRNDFTEPEIEHWIRFREEHDEQIKALKQLINLGNEYGLDLSVRHRPLRKQQWTYMATSFRRGGQYGAAMSFGRVPPSSTYSERDLKSGKITGDRTHRDHRQLGHEVAYRALPAYWAITTRSSPAIRNWADLVRRRLWR